MENRKKNLMRLITAFFLGGLLNTALAAQPQLPGLQPLPPPPPFDAHAQDTDLLPLPPQSPRLPPNSQTGDAALGQQEITKQVVEQTVEEFRAGGKLYMIKITPKVGPPYYLVDDLGDGKFTHYEHLDPGFRPPRWVIHRF